MLRLMLVIMLVVGFCVGCPDNDNDSNVQRDFYIENHDVMGMWKPCGIYYSDASEEITESKAEVEEHMILLYPGSSYILSVDYYNDQVNTTWIEFEIFVDGERWSSSGIVADYFGKKGSSQQEDGSGQARIILFDPVPYSFAGKEIQIDVWLEDENGVQSEVYSFDVRVIHLRYLNGPTSAE